MKSKSKKPRMNKAREPNAKECAICNALFPTLREIKEHAKTVHPDCGYGFRVTTQPDGSRTVEMAIPMSTAVKLGWEEPCDRCGARLPVARLVFVQMFTEDDEEDPFMVCRRCASAVRGQLNRAKREVYRIPLEG